MKMLLWPGGPIGCSIDQSNWTLPPCIDSSRLEIRAHGDHKGGFWFVLSKPSSHAHLVSNVLFIHVEKDFLVVMLIHHRSANKYL